MNLTVWIVWSRNGQMRKRRLVRWGLTPQERKWQERTREAQREWVRGCERLRP